MNIDQFRGGGEARSQKADVQTDHSNKVDQLSEECRMVCLAEGLLRQRKRRAEHFDTSLFGEAGWDMLLELYIRSTSGVSTTTAQLLGGTATPTSAARRWLEQLEAQRLMIRRAHPHESHTQFAELTDQARQAMEAYLHRVAQP